MSVSFFVFKYFKSENSVYDMTSWRAKRIFSFAVTENNILVADVFIWRTETEARTHYVPNHSQFKLKKKVSCFFAQENDTPVKSCCKIYYRFFFFWSVRLQY